MPEKAISVSIQILSALHYAHSRRVIHRDVKPSNILFTRGGRAKLGDFGVAKMLKETQKVAPTKIGTVPYMSPEQLLGKATFQSDIYAVGVVLYEMLTGVMAFDGDTDYVIMKKIEKAEFKPPRMINPAIPGWLEYVILRAMAKDPRNRYQTAEEMTRALKAGPPRAEPEPKIVEPVKEVPRRVILPDVLGMDGERAKRALEEKGLRVRVGFRNVKDRRLGGRALAQDPIAGKGVVEGAEVAVTVGRYVGIPKEKVREEREEDKPVER